MWPSMSPPTVGSTSKKESGFKRTTSTDELNKLSHDQETARFKSDQQKTNNRLASSEHKFRQFSLGSAASEKNKGSVMQQSSQRHAIPELAPMRQLRERVDDIEAQMRRVQNDVKHKNERHIVATEAMSKVIQDAKDGFAQQFAAFENQFKQEIELLKQTCKDNDLKQQQHIDHLKQQLESLGETMAGLAEQDTAPILLENRDKTIEQESALFAGTASSKVAVRIPGMEPAFTNASQFSTRTTNLKRVAERELEEGASAYAQKRAKTWHDRAWLNRWP